MADEEFLTLFDLFVKWPLRLGKEGPFIEGFLSEAGARRVLDAGAGSGRHASWLAKKGYEVIASDLAECMVEETRRHASEEGVALETLACSFESLPEQLTHPVDAVLCLGNSLSMLPDREGVRRSVEAFARILRPGGLLVAHVLNYRGLRKKGKRVSRPTRVPGGDLLLKIFDLEPEATRVNLVRLTEERPGSWRSIHRWAPLLPLSLEELVDTFSGAGFEEPRSFGSADGTPYEADSSYDLFLIAVRATG